MAPNNHSDLDLHGQAGQGWSPTASEKRNWCSPWAPQSSTTRNQFNDIHQGSRLEVEVHILHIFFMFCICTLSYIINKQWCIYIYTCILCISISYHRLYTHHICVLLLWSRMLIYCISQGRSTWSSPFLWSQSTCGIAANLHLLLFHLLSKCIYLVTFHVRRWADKKYSSWDLVVSVYPRL